MPYCKLRSYAQPPALWTTWPTFYKWFYVKLKNSSSRQGYPLHQAQTEANHGKVLRQGAQPAPNADATGKPDGKPWMVLALFSALLKTGAVARFGTRGKG